MACSPMTAAELMSRLMMGPTLLGTESQPHHSAAARGSWGVEVVLDLRVDGPCDAAASMDWQGRPWCHEPCNSITIGATAGQGGPPLPPNEHPVSVESPRAARCRARHRSAGAVCNGPVARVPGELRVRAAARLARAGRPNLWRVRVTEATWWPVGRCATPRNRPNRHY